VLQSFIRAGILAANLAAFRDRYLPAGAGVSDVADVATSMFTAGRFFFAAMRADQA